MAGLFDLPVWTLENPQRPREYVITGPQGELLANVARVPTAPPAQGGNVPYANPHAAADESRVLVRVAGQDDVPIFFVDRVGDPMMGTPQLSVVAPDGSLIGHMVVKSSGVKGIFKFMALGGDVTANRTICDAHNQEIYTITSSMRDHVVNDPQGNELAQIEITQSPAREKARRLTLKQRYQFQDPMRTLIAASPLVLDLTTPLT